MKTHIITHCHTDLSNGTTNIDSVTKYQEYVDRCVEEGMHAIAFTEHGNMFNWLYKKEYCESKGIKYIHGIEMYVTKSLDEKVRDNYHTCMYAKNFDGVKELNKLVSKAYNREDNHFYYVPRISFEELKNTSDNILITTACIGGGLRPNSEIKNDYIKFLAENKHRCFLEVQHHLVNVQANYNREMVELSKTYNIPLIMGTDTHALNETHVKGRSILQKAKNIHFENEDGWDISFRTFDELKKMYAAQGALTENEFMEAAKNTHVLADMVEGFEVDKQYKYPKLYDDSLAVLKQKINEGIIRRGVNKYPNYKEYIDRINVELEAYQHNKAVDYLLLDEGLKTEAREIGIEPGPSRGSVSGSIIAYLIGMTDMDSIKRNLNFERFMNTARVSLADVDTDWPPTRREEVKNLLYSKEKLYCSEIVTFNTVKLKGSIRDVGRALNIDLQIVNEICKNIEDDEQKYREQYPELFEYVDIISGTVVSLGIHPCGTIVSPIPLDENVGLITTTTTDKPISMLNMNEINDLFYVKLDVLGLENVELINDTCELAGIERITPDNVPDDENVWKAIRDNTLGIFQWNGETGSRYIKHLFKDETIEKIKNEFDRLGLKFNYMDLFSVGNGAIRPGGASYRDALSEGIFYDNGHEGINKFLAPTLGYLVYQEQIMDFLVQFCGYEKGEADIVRRAVAKKKNSEQYLPEIKRRFIEYMRVTENMPYDEAEKIIEVFLKVILDSSDYLFSLNHSDAYSYIGYMCGWLRENYPFEFLTVMLNHSIGILEKTKEITTYAKEKGINILPPTFGKSRGAYFFNKEENSIYKGIASVKYINNDVAETLYKMYHENEIKDFIQFLFIAKEYKITSRHLDVLVKIGYFREFGTTKKLLKLVELFNTFSSKKQFKRDMYNEAQMKLLEKHAETITDKMVKGVNVESLLRELETMVPNEEFAQGTLIQFENEFIGSISYIDDTCDKRIFVVTEVIDKYATPFVTLYKPYDGTVQKVRVDKNFYAEKKLKQYDTVYLSSVEAKNKRKKVDGKWTISEEVDYYIYYYIL